MILFFFFFVQRRFFFYVDGFPVRGAVHLLCIRLAGAPVRLQHHSTFLWTGAIQKVQQDAGRTD